jgi:hypothetical protein
MYNFGIMIYANIIILLNIGEVRFNFILFTSESITTSTLDYILISLPRIYFFYLNLFLLAFFEFIDSLMFRLKTNAIISSCTILIIVINNHKEHIIFGVMI